MHWTLLLCRFKRPLTPAVFLPTIIRQHKQYSPSLIRRFSFFFFLFSSLPGFVVPVPLCLNWYHSIFYMFFSVYALADISLHTGCALSFLCLHLYYLFTFLLSLSFASNFPANLLDATPFPFHFVPEYSASTSIYKGPFLPIFFFNSQ